MRPETVKKREEYMVKCFDCFCKNGIKTGVNLLAKECGVSTATLFLYFGTIDNLILESTDFCMAKVESDFMKRAPKAKEELMQFVLETPEWTLKKHGKKYRFMYQVYSSPKYISYGKRFFERVTERYNVYAEELSPKLGIEKETLLACIYTFVRACVHYAMFGEKDYLDSQINAFVKVLARLLNNQQA